MFWQDHLARGTDRQHTYASLPALLLCQLGPPSTRLPQQSLDFRTSCGPTCLPAAYITRQDSCSPAVQSMMQMMQMMMMLSTPDCLGCHQFPPRMLKHPFPGQTSPKEEKICHVAKDGRSIVCSNDLCKPSPPMPVDDWYAPGSLRLPSSSDVDLSTHMFLSWDPDVRQ